MSSMRRSRGGSRHFDAGRGIVEKPGQNAGRPSVDTILFFHEPSSRGAHLSAEGRIGREPRDGLGPLVRRRGEEKPVLP